jgi:hypothetical protein
MLGNKYISYQDAKIQCQLQDLRLRRDQICLDFANKLLETPEFRNWLPCFRGEMGRTLRNANHLSIPRVRTERYANSPIPYMVKLWNREASGV